MFPSGIVAIASGATFTTIRLARREQREKPRLIHALTAPLLTAKSLIGHGLRTKAYDLYAQGRGVLKEQSRTVYDLLPVRPDAVLSPITATEAPLFVKQPNLVSAKPCRKTK